MIDRLIHEWFRAVLFLFGIAWPVSARRWRTSLSLPRADAEALHWEMFWPCVSLLVMCAAPLGWALSPLILGTA